MRVLTLVQFIFRSLKMHLLSDALGYIALDPGDAARQ